MPAALRLEFSSRIGWTARFVCERCARLKEIHMRAGIPVGLVVAILLVIATVAMVFVRAFGTRGDGWDDILAFLPFLAGGIALGLLMNFA